MGGFQVRSSFICATTVCTACEHAQPRWAKHSSHTTSAPAHEDSPRRRMLGYAREGAQVAVLDADGEAAAATVKAITEAGGGGHLISARPATVESLDPKIRDCDDTMWALTSGGAGVPF